MQVIYEEMHTLGAEYAKAKADRIYLMEFRKSKKAILMAGAEKAKPGCSAAHQEREAYANPEYLELLKGIQSAVEIEEFCKNKLDVIKMQFESWRTKQSTEREKMKVEGYLT